MAVSVTDCPGVAGLGAAVRVVAEFVTISLSAAEVLAAKLVSVPYTAVMLWVAALSVEVLNVAVPPLRVPVPKVVEPSRKVTTPVGVPAPGATAATVAVKVSNCPITAGLAVTVRVVLVAA